MDLQQTCLENNQRLGPHLASIAAGQMSEALEPFAKAYLGMYYQLDNSVPPRLRIASLASAELAAAIMEGMQAFLNSGELATAEQIGRHYLEGKGLGTGYVLLAAVEEYCVTEPARILDLRDEAINALLCYQFLHTSYHSLPWYEYLTRQRPQQVIEALKAFWSPLLRAKREQLPGLPTVIRSADHAQLAAPLAMHLLEAWPQCDVYTLRRLMQWALTSARREQLVAIADRRIEELAISDIRRKVYWLATAFIISPEGHAEPLSGYIGRTKEKVLPLLDYLLALLKDPAIEVQLSAMELARLIRIIAPIFVRNTGRGGLLDDNSTKVLWLFEQLADYPAEQRAGAVRWLQGVRVMRCYDDILETLHSR